MPEPLIALVHITARVERNDPRWWGNACQAWFQNCDQPERVNYVLAVHESRSVAIHTVRNYRLPMSSWTRIYINDGQDTPVSQINFGFLRTKREPVLVGMMDDLFPPPHWDTRILEALTILDAPFILNCESGFTHKLINAGAMTRAYYEQFGYVHHPDYEQYYACSDREFSEVAYQRGQVIERFDIVFDHRHPSNGKAEWDELYRKQQDPEMQRLSQEIYEKRRAAGFPKGSVL